MTVKVDQTPLWVGAGAALPPSLSLKKQLTFEDAYEETYRLWAERDGVLLVPRNIVNLEGVEDRMVLRTPYPFKSTFKPRDDDQARAVEKSVNYLLKNRNHVLSAPTGKGKTAMAMEIIARIQQPTLVVVHKADLYDNWIEDAGKFLGLAPEDVGMIQGDNVSIKPLTLGMIQSLMKPGRYPESVYQSFGFVIWDECHRVGADKFAESAWNLPARKRLGLSATPKRKDGKSNVIEAHIGPVAVTISKADLTPKVYVLQTEWMPPVIQRNGQWVKFPFKAGRTMKANKSMAEDMNRNELIVDLIGMAYRKNRKVIFLTDLLSHIELVGKSLTKQVPGSRIGKYVGGLTTKQREVAASKQVILSTYKMASEGTNIPSMDTCVLGLPRADVVQMVGRILRKHDGKKEPVVFDLVDVGHKLFIDYHKARMKWYRSIGAEIEYVGT